MTQPTRVVRITREDWPGGVSDGTTLACGVCGNVQNLDYTVDDRAWEKAIPEDLRRGVVCLRCYLDLFGSDGAGAGWITRIQWIGVGLTIDMAPSAAYLWEAGSPAPFTKAEAANRIQALVGRARGLGADQTTIGLLGESAKIAGGESGPCVDGGAEALRRYRDGGRLCLRS